MRSFLRGAVVSTVAGALAVAAPGAVAGAAPKHARAVTTPTPAVVVSGLNNPRQLSLPWEGALLIAEAGTGGKQKVVSPEGPAFVGSTGSISAVLAPQFARNERPLRIVTGLYSASGNQPFPGFAATGSDGVSATDNGRIYIAETAGPPELPLPSGKQAGKLLVARPFGAAKAVADITGYEVTHDPDGKGVDSNPYAVLALRGGRTLVADAAGNDVLLVRANGKRSVFHVFPNITTGACAGRSDPSPKFSGCNYVPTSLAQDRAGHIYVGGLAGEAPNAGMVTELDTTGKHVLHTWTGFDSVTGVAVGSDGSLYVSELDAAQAHAPDTGVPGLSVTGVLTKVSSTGARRSLDVPFPAGVAADSFGNVYVSAWSLAPGTGVPLPGLNSIDTSGQVWRLHC